METINPFAIYDTLFVGNKLQRYIGDFNSSEVQLFCYFSCLLSLYEGNPTSFWGYKFIKNDLGVPLSTEVYTALDCLLVNNELEKADNYYKITSEGKSKCEVLSEFGRFENRNKYLEASCESLLALPIGYIRNSINSEPIVRAANNSTVRTLVDEENGAIALLYEQFELLKEAIDTNDSDLFVPAVTWLKYLQLPKDVNQDA
ncbi:MULTISPECIES: hypothetical protein [Bacteroidales]|jgi:hypothetical protein|uniref:hypothetical protein n=1 Tax=Bacteroidales TaxID=171549 RepID=UPI00051D47E4|nr:MULTISPECIES: hypothetical protein [Bacteroidales]KGL47603.1 hypothetical protein HQ49_08220 [Porphyromonas gulae]MCF2709854.1 hypothetical protein [Bacteroides pyogenes]MDD3063861.1 hypothetical protein [Massilibacteroides sp.]MDD3995110.1 hypothetical protein [Bacilli bacterium]